MIRRSKSIADKWEKDPHEGLPTAYELASLAAQIMHAVPETELTGDFEDIVEAAWNLHYCAASRIGELVERRSKFKDSKKIFRPILAKLPKPKKFPVAIKTVLGLMMPNKSVEERFGIYREYLTVFYRKDMDEANWNNWVRQHLQQMNHSGFDEVSWRAFGIHFYDFMHRRQEQTRHERAHKAGVARAKKVK